MYTVLFSILFLAVGLLGGWFVYEKYQALMLMHEEYPHEFEHLFEHNPHPEIFDADGNIDRGEYYVINFPPDFDPEEDGFYIEPPEDYEA